MAKIFFSLSGEGRGHATRVRALAEHLRQDHEISLFTPGEAWSFLAPIYASTEVRVRRIPGLRFHYNRNRRLDFLATGREAARYAAKSGMLVATLTRILEREQPDLVISDFEPALPRAARRCGIPFLSVNHQHFLTTYDLSCLPRALRWHAAYMGWVVKGYYSGQQESVVSSFYFPPLRPGMKGVTQVGVMLRPEVLQATACRGRHLVAYWRRFAGQNVLDALKASGREVRVYGLGDRPSEGNLRFHAIHETRFVEDLATCDALISTAGNQLVGEALYFNKPVLALPEARNFEQSINGYFLKASGAGETLGLEQLTGSDVRRFLDRLEDYRACIDSERMNGLPPTLDVIHRHLPSVRRSSMPLLTGALAS